MMTNFSRWAITMIAWCVAGSAFAQSMGGPMEHMIKEIAADFAATADYTGVERGDSRVMAAMRSVPREEFVPDTQREAAYFNRPLSIGYGQTISQPYIVALMTHFLTPQPTDRVLEIGTGSGYQAAVLGELVHSVYTVEIIPELATQAAEKLEAMGYDNIHTRVGDGWNGWPEEGPYDGIIITAAGPEIPPLLVDQLKPGGRMVLPLGGLYAGQMLTLVTKKESGEIITRDLLPVAFVPLTGEH
jgi:protein-L-isoaspartate(D-aspartate) O-methyltransferase